MEATSDRTRNFTCCDEPIFGPLLDRDLLDVGDEPLRLPRGVLGAGCGFAFTLGRSYPEPDEPISRELVGQALVDCRLGLQVLGRRVPGMIPLNGLTATADFALSVAYRLGPHIVGWHELDLGAAPLSARIDGNLVASGDGASIMGHPFEAVAWLARARAERGRQIEAGEIVAVGSCVGVLQVLPGQVLEADGGALGKLTLVFA
jgi:2-keto-4-pentenoate hydratase